MRHVVVAAAIIKRRGRVLITQRRRGSTLSLKWEFPGGRVKIGEKLGSCLKREIMEELGLEIAVLKHYHTARHTYRGKSHKIYYFFCRITSGEPKALAVNDFRWIKPTQPNSYSILAPDVVVMNKLALRERNH